VSKLFPWKSEFACWEDGDGELHSNLRDILVDEFKDDPKDTTAEILAWCEYQGTLAVWGCSRLIMTGPLRGQVWEGGGTIIPGLKPFAAPGGDGHCGDFIDMILYIIHSNKFKL